MFELNNLKAAFESFDGKRSEKTAEIEIRRGKAVFNAGTKI
jgi:hypothetical protein